MTTRPMEERNTPVVELVGTDGNAFAVMGTVSKALKAAEWTKDERDEFMNDMMAGDYNDMLCVVCETCEVD